MIIKLNDFKSELEDIKFNMPENIRFSGRLLIIGGSHQNFSVATEALALSQSHGAGNSILALPDNLKHLLPKNLPTNINLLPSDKNGSFNLEAGEYLLSLSLHSEGILLPGMLGRGSQTSQVILSLVQQLNLPVIMAGDSVLFLQNEVFYLQMPNLFLLLSLSLVQRLMGKFEVISLRDQPNIIEQKLELIASNIKLSFCFILAGWIYAVIEGEVIRIKLNKNYEDVMMPKLASSLASVKTWSKAEQKFNFMLATKITFQL
jgi:hypothetical protein